MQDALFLHTHKSWSPSELADADQDLLDILDAIQFEGAQAATKANALAESKARAAARRSR